MVEAKNNSQGAAAAASQSPTRRSRGEQLDRSEKEANKIKDILVEGDPANKEDESPLKNQKKEGQVG